MIDFIEKSAVTYEHIIKRIWNCGVDKDPCRLANADIFRELRGSGNNLPKLEKVKYGLAYSLAFMAGSHIGLDMYDVIIDKIQKINQIDTVDSMCEAMKPTFDFVMGILDETI